MNTAKSILLALFFSYLLGACGLKGPLYLPQDEAIANPAKVQNAKTAKQEQKQKQQKKEKEDANEC